MRKHINSDRRTVWDPHPALFHPGWKQSVIGDYCCKPQQGVNPLGNENAVDFFVHITALIRH